MDQRLLQILQISLSPVDIKDYYLMNIPNNTLKIDIWHFQSSTYEVSQVEKDKHQHNTWLHIPAKTGTYNIERTS